MDANVRNDESAWTSCELLAFRTRSGSESAYFSINRLQRKHFGNCSTPSNRRRHVVRAICTRSNVLGGGSDGNGCYLCSLGGVGPNIAGICIYFMHCACEFPSRNENLSTAASDGCKIGQFRIWPFENVIPISGGTRSQRMHVISANCSPFWAKLMQRPWRDRQRECRDRAKQCGRHLLEFSRAVGRACLRACYSFWLCGWTGLPYVKCQPR